MIGWSQVTIAILWLYAFDRLTPAQDRQVTAWLFRRFTKEQQ